MQPWPPLQNKISTWSGSFQIIVVLGNLTLRLSSMVSILQNLGCFIKLAGLSNCSHFTSPAMQWSVDWNGWLVFQTNVNSISTSECLSWSSTHIQSLNAMKRVSLYFDKPLRAAPAQAITNCKLLQPGTQIKWKPLKLSTTFHNNFWVLPKGEFAMGTPAKQPLCLPAVNTALSCIPQSLQLSTAQGPRSGMRNNLKQQQ